MVVEIPWEPVSTEPTFQILKDEGRNLRGDSPSTTGGDPGPSPLPGERSATTDVGQ